jgi:hypothetical protein
MVSFLFFCPFLIFVLTNKPLSYTFTLHLSMKLMKEIINNKNILINNNNILKYIIYNDIIKIKNQETFKIF